MASQELTATARRSYRRPDTAEHVCDSLNDKGDGNQFILVLGLTKKARIELDSEERALDGIPYRFMLDNTAGISKVLTSEHDAVTRDIIRQIDRLCVAMGIDPVHELSSGGNTTQLLCAGSKGKQPDGWCLPQAPAPRP